MKILSVITFLSFLFKRYDQKKLENNCSSSYEIPKEAKTIHTSRKFYRKLLIYHISNKSDFKRIYVLGVNTLFHFYVKGVCER